MNKNDKKPDVKLFSSKFFARTKISYLITMPFIAMMIIPAIIADIFASIYQAINFPVYKIPKVKRSKYIIIDRHHLSHLNFMEKVFCVFCGYVNGVIQYCAEIGSRTEEFWCPIKHKKKTGFKHARYDNYIEYEDTEEYHQKRKNIRLKMKKDLD
ncbi:hypothetical protein [Arcobacter peruensis]|uniref:hypothetical protein n=1 Tax=Arcobacter peruensis TaxID=2320140 RepID=UPI000F087A0E|nr:hypothetical protein [Arcobacter peruensis]